MDRGQTLRNGDVRRIEIERAAFVFFGESRLGFLGQLGSGDTRHDLDAFGHGWRQGHIGGLLAVALDARVRHEGRAGPWRQQGD
ncbi:MAG: hypothetical protein ACKOEG_12005 [Chthoniobacterales bacterium]